MGRPERGREARYEGSSRVRRGESRLGQDFPGSVDVAVASSHDGEHICQRLCVRGRDVGQLGSHHHESDALIGSRQDQDQHFPRGVVLDFDASHSETRRHATTPSSNSESNSARKHIAMSHVKQRSEAHIPGTDSAPSPVPSPSSPSSSSSPWRVAPPSQHRPLAHTSTP